MNTKLNLHKDSTVITIRSYADRIITVQNTEYSSSLIVTPEQILSWPLSNISELNSAQFSPVFELDFQPELVILGTGETLVFPDAKQTQTLINAQIGLEVMDTAAACRTFNVLADDGRKVVAFLLV